MTRVRLAGFVALSGLLFLVAALGFAPASAQEDAPAAVQKWEYRVLRGTPDVREFNDLGREGWELCGAGSPTLFVFKRPIPR